MTRTGLAFVLLATASLARAQPSADPQEQARTHFKAGTELYDENNFRGALTEFKRAYELAPSYKLLFNIGQVEMELQDYAEALKAYSRYLREGGADVPPDRVTQLNGEIERLKGRVGYATIQAPAGAEIVIDNAPAGYAPLPEAVALNTGRHEITVRATGHDPVTRAIDVAGKQQVSVVFDTPVPTTTVPARPVVVPQDRTTHPLYSKVLIGGGSVALVGGIALGIFELSRVPSNCSTSADTCLGPPGNADLKTAESAVRLSNVGWMVGGVGFAALVGGIVWYVGGRTVEHDPGIAAVPWVTPEGAGLAFSGRL